MTFRPLSQLLSDSGEDRRGVALVDGREITLATFRDDVGANAKHLKDRGCRRGVLAAEDTYWAAVGLMALHYAKAIAVLPSSLQPGALEQCEGDVIITDHMRTKVSSPLAYSLTRGNENFGVPATLDPNQAKLELFTSGSTGKPKAVTKTLAEMESEAWVIEEAFGSGLAGASLVFATVPHYHLYGLSFKIMWPLCSGRRFVSKTYEFWGSLASALTSKAILVTSPAHLSRIPALPTLEKNGLSFILSAGATLSAKVANEAMAALGRPVMDILGSTETGVIAFCQRSQENLPWRAFPGVNIKQGTDGHMAVQSPHLAQTIAADNWYETADQIERQPDGLFRLRGRTDRVLKIEGHRVSIPELEHKLELSNLVAQAAVLAIEGKSTRLGAVAVLSAAGLEALNDIGAFRLGRRLRQELSRALPPSGLPKHWRFVAEMPVSPLGKRRDADLGLLFKAERRKVLVPILRAVTRSNAGVELSLFIPPDLTQVRGHFPGLPIVPGVALLDWAIKFSGQCFDIPIAFTKAFQVKFRRIVTAPSDVLLKLSPRLSQGQIAFEYSQGGDVLSSGAFSLDQ